MIGIKDVQTDYRFIGPISLEIFSSPAEFKQITDTRNLNSWVKPSVAVQSAHADLLKQTEEALMSVVSENKDFKLGNSEKSIDVIADLQFPISSTAENFDKYFKQVKTLVEALEMRGINVNLYISGYFIDSNHSFGFAIPIKSAAQELNWDKFIDIFKFQVKEDGTLPLTPFRAISFNWYETSGAKQLAGYGKPACACQNIEQALETAYKQSFSQAPLTVLPDKTFIDAEKLFVALSERGIDNADAIVSDINDMFKVPLSPEAALNK
jgi:hypothetical protein